MRGSLYHLLRSKNKDEIKIRSKQIALDIAHGIGYLHGNNIVHGDLKSLNILLTENYRAKVSDFGLSIYSQDDKIASSHDINTLTKRWMAPELLNEKKPNFSRASDIYSYGKTLFELVTGKIPFANIKNDAVVVACILQGEEEDTVPADIPCPKPISDLIRLCLFRAPEKRPTIEQVISILSADENTESQNNTVTDISADTYSSVLSNLYSMTTKVGK